MIHAEWVELIQKRLDHYFQYSKMIWANSMKKRRFLIIYLIILTTDDIHLINLVAHIDSIEIAPFMA